MSLATSVSVFLQYLAEHKRNLARETMATPSWGFCMDLCPPFYFCASRGVQLEDQEVVMHVWRTRHGTNMSCFRAGDV
jgi:hypothetical protein